MNPFNPAFGLRPKHFIGRNDIIEEFLSSQINPNNPWRSTVLVGVRGSGKTSILSDIQLRLKDTDAIVVSVSPDDEFLDRILGQIARQLPTTIAAKLSKIKSISVSYGATVSLEKNSNEPGFARTFEFQITQMLEALDETKIVFLIDESQKHTSEIRTFISTYQQLIMKQFPVSLIMAGLPEVVSDILNDDVLTFLRRANRVDLENIDINLVKADYNNVFKFFGQLISQEILTRAAEATQGFPYLIQLVGYYLWENIAKSFDGDILEQTMVESKATLFKNVHQLVFNSLTNVEREFIFSMTYDIGNTKIADVLTRLEKDKNYITQYRTRLISKGVIKASGHGLITLTYPYMREFLELKRHEIGLW